MKWYSNIINFFKYVLIQPKIEVLGKPMYSIDFLDHIQKSSELATTLNCFKQIGWADMYDDETFAFYVLYNRTRMGRGIKTEEIEGFIGTFPVFIKENTFPAFKELNGKCSLSSRSQRKTGGAND